MQENDLGLGGGADLDQTTTDGEGELCQFTRTPGLALTSPIIIAPGRLPVLYVIV